MTKEYIIDAIRRTAEGNAGKPLGEFTFSKETGIRVTDWRGKFWARWGDAVREAGFAPNEPPPRYEEELLMQKVVGLAEILGKLPSQAELRMRSRSDPTFPSETVISKRLGPRPARDERIAEYCRRRGGLEHIIRMCEVSLASDDSIKNDDVRHAPVEVFGHVYLLKSGRYYKIGRSNAPGRREREIQLQMPEKAHVAHTIETDDPSGIERYWHQRFDAKRKNGEWFELSADDVKAFRRRKFM